MRGLIAVSIGVLAFFMYSCEYRQPTSNSQNSEEFVTEPKNRDADYYSSKGFQIFPQYNLAIKCPVILTDISHSTKTNFDLHYSGIENNEAFYEMIVINLPLGYYDLSDDEKAKFERDFLAKKFQGKPVITEMGGQEVNAGIMEYTHQDGQGKGIAFIYNGKIFSFNIIAKEGINERFNKLTNNIVFYKNEKDGNLSGSSNNKSTDFDETQKSESKKQSITVQGKDGSYTYKKENIATGTNERSLTKSNSENPKKSGSVHCTNCSDVNLEFRNYKWDNSWDGSSNDLKLASFNVINRSSSAIREIKVKWTVYDPDGAPVDSGEDNLNLALETIEPNSGKLCYGMKFAHKKTNQTMKISIVSVK